VRKSLNEILEFKYHFRAKIWKYQGDSSWYFATLPILLSKKIRVKHCGQEEGWGRLKASASIGNTIWNTSIWYDTKKGAYILPVKLIIRKKENIETGSNVRVTLKIHQMRWVSALSKKYKPLTK